MKNTLLRTVVIFVALCIYPSIHAYDFECDGFYYDITSDSTVSVTHDHGDFYKGDISIPNQATHNGKTYQVTTIDDRAFEGKEQLTSVHISNSIDSIGDYAFCACPLLTQVSLGEGITYMGNDIFRSSGLTSITITRNVSQIGLSPFSACTQLTEINVDEANPYFSSLDGVLTDKNRTTIVAYPAGKGKRYIIPDGITKIGTHSFFACYPITYIHIPNSVKTIELFAFASCTDLDTVILGNSVDSIEVAAFRINDRLKTIYSMNPIPPAAHTGAFDSFNSFFIQCTLHVPAGSLQAYKNAEVWKNFKNIVENDFTGIERPSPDKAKIFGNKNSISFRNIEPGTDISIYDTTGKCIKTFAVDGDCEIPFPSGIYLIKYAGRTVKIIL